MSDKKDRVSILELIGKVPIREKPSVEALAHSEPDVSGIAQHVWDAHEAAKRKIKRHGEVTASITFVPDWGAFMLSAEQSDVIDTLCSLGPQAKITIHF